MNDDYREADAYRWPDDRWHLTPDQRTADDRMTAALAGTLRTGHGARTAAPV